MTTQEFAVLDLETTGLFPARHDRVLEVAVVRLDPTGRVIDEYATLVNPNRDVGPSSLHGITAADLLSAPEFQEIAGDVLSRMRGAIVVGHNIRFDLGFVRAECSRIRIDLPEVPSLCTMRLAHAADPAAGTRKLELLCDHFGIDPGDSHTALDDARAAGQLFIACLARLNGAIDRLPIDAPAAAADWPNLTISNRSWRREHAKRRRTEETSRIARLIANLPQTTSETPRLGAYLALVDRILEDRFISEAEAASVADLATEIGLSREEAARAHEQYLSSLVGLAFADGQFTELEQRDLEAVRQLLDVEPTRFAAMVETAQSTAAARTPPPAAPSPDLAGKTVCFTGQLNCKINGEPISRVLAERLAKERGMIPKSGVSRDLDILVTADPHSMSGKAKKAREYGVRIVAEPVFWTMINVVREDPGRVAEA